MKIKTLGVKKVVRRIISTTLALMLIVSLLPIDTLFFAEEQSSTEKYVVWEANPSNIGGSLALNPLPASGSIGAIWGGAQVRNSYINVAEMTTDGKGYKVVFNKKNGYTILNSDFKGKNGYPTCWMADKIIFAEALKYGQLSFEIRRSDNSEVVPDVTIGMSTAWGVKRFRTVVINDMQSGSEWTPYLSEQFTDLSEYYKSGTSTLNDGCQDGWFYIEIGGDDNVSNEKPVTIEIRKVCLIFSEKDRLAFNKSLADMGYVKTGAYDWTAMTGFKKDANNNIDYFGKLVELDSISKFSPNNVERNITNLTNDENGSIAISANAATANEVINIEVSSANDYRLGSLSLRTESGAAVGYTKLADNKYSFAMPRENVSVKAEFCKKTANDDKTYVIWEANPETPQTVPVTSVENCWKPNITDSSCVSTTEGAYYKTKFTSNGNAVINSGLNCNWMSDVKLIEHITKFTQMKFDIRRTDTSNVNPQITLGMITAWHYPSQAEYAVFNDGLSTAKGDNWTSYSTPFVEGIGGALNKVDKYNDHWGGGKFFISAYGDVANTASATNPVDIELRNLRLVLRESDRLFFNQYLADNGYVRSGSYNWYSNDITKIEKDENGNPDYFKALISYDKDSLYTDNYANHTITNTTPSDAKGTTEISRTSAKTNTTITVKAIPAEGYILSKVLIVGSDGESTIVTNIKGGVGTFKMPDDDISVCAYFIKESEKIKLLFMAEPVMLERDGSGNVGKVEFAGEQKIVSNGDQGSLWSFKFDKNSNAVKIPGRINRFYTKLPATAEITFKAKAVTESGTRKLLLGAEGTAFVKQLDINNDLTEYTVKASDFGNVVPTHLTFGLSDKQDGDTLYISEVYIWSNSADGVGYRERFSLMYDISDYKVEETNEQVGVLGDPDGAQMPFEFRENNEFPHCISWSLSLTETFKGISPWYISFEKDVFADFIYSLGFMTSENNYMNDISRYLETGYMEFYIKSSEDNVILPLMIRSGKQYSYDFTPIYVEYKKELADNQGYMRVTVPLMYLYEMGCDITAIKYINIYGTQAIKEDVLLTAFRFYSNAAKEIPYVEPQPEPDPEYILKLDNTYFAGKINYKNATLTVPANTYIWELLAATVFDNSDMTLLILDENNNYYSDENAILRNGMVVIVQHKGYDYDNYSIIAPELPEDNLNIEDNDNSNSDTSKTEETKVIIKRKKVKKKNNSNNGIPLIIPIAIISALVVIAGAVSVIIVYKKRKKAK